MYFIKFPLDSPHLHRGVTHVLCDLKSGIDIVEASIVCSGQFCDEDRGKAICDRLNSLGITEGTKLVSEHFIRSIWGDEASVV